VLVNNAGVGAIMPLADVPTKRINDIFGHQLTWLTEIIELLAPHVWLRAAMSPAVNVPTLV